MNSQHTSYLLVILHLNSASSGCSSFNWVRLKISIRKTTNNISYVYLFGRVLIMNLCVVEDFLASREEHITKIHSSHAADNS